MPLIICPDCGKQISNSAKSCPNCGWVIRDGGQRGNYVLAKPADRLIAYFIDILFIVLIAILACVLYFLQLPIVIISLCFYAVIIIVPIIYCAQGTSFGKKRKHLYVVNKDTGVKLSFGSMFLRETIGKWLSGLIFCLGWIWILIDKDRQGWHDKLCSSVVVVSKNK